MAKPTSGPRARRGAPPPRGAATTKTATTASSSRRRGLTAGGALRRTLVEQVLAQDYTITHTTLQVDHSVSATAAHAADGTVLPRAQVHCEDSHGPVHRDAPHEH